MRFVWRLADQERMEVTRFLYGNTIQTAVVDRVKQVIGIRGIAPTRFYCISIIPVAAVTAVRVRQVFAGDAT